MFDFEVLTLSISDPDIQAKLNALGQKRFSLINFHPITDASSVNHASLVFVLERDNRELLDRDYPEDWPSGVEVIDKDTGHSRFVPATIPFEPAHAATESPVPAAA